MVTESAVTVVIIPHSGPRARSVSAAVANALAAASRLKPTKAITTIPNLRNIRRLPSSTPYGRPGPFAAAPARK
jgi:hypothetical protein